MSKFIFMLVRSFTLIIVRVFNLKLRVIRCSNKAQARIHRIQLQYFGSKQFFLRHFFPSLIQQTDAFR